MGSLLSFLCALASMLGWAVAYGLVIRRNYLDKTYGIPLVALGVNLAWEFAFSFLVRPPNPDSLGWLWTAINITWLGLDVVILMQVIKYGPRENWPSPAYFWGALVGALVFGLAGILATTYQFGDWEGRWASFVDNLMMSILFIQMLGQRGIRGQSIYIAFGKLIGTLAVGSGYLLANPGMPLQWYLSISSLFFDGLYLALLYRKIRAAGLNPWARF